MSRHFLRYVRQEDYFPFLKCLGCRADERNSGTDPDRWRVRFSIEVKEMQSLSITAEDVEMGAMKTTTVGQNVAQAVQYSFDRGLIGESAGRIQQSSISIFSAPHNAGTCCAHDEHIIELTHVRM